MVYMIYSLSNQNHQSLRRFGASPLGLERPLYNLQQDFKYITYMKLGTGSHDLPSSVVDSIR